MREIPHIPKLQYFACFLLICCFFSCSNITNIFKGSFNFDVSKSLSVNVPSQSPSGQSVSAISPIGVTNDDLVKQQTSTSLVKSVKLTALKFTPDDSSFPLTNFDTLKLSVTKDQGASELMLGTFAGRTNSYNLSDTNFVSYFKDSKARFMATFKLTTAPAKTITIQTDYTFTFTADPL